MKKDIKVTYGFKDDLTGATIYKIEISKYQLAKWLVLPGCSHVFPIAVWGDPKKNKLSLKKIAKNLKKKHENLTPPKNKEGR